MRFHYCKRGILLCKSAGRYSTESFESKKNRVFCLCGYNSLSGVINPFIILRRPSCWAYEDHWLQCFGVIETAG